jgi:hypothetical protein
MSKIKELLTKAKDKLLSAARELWETEPAVVSGAVVSVLIGVAATFKVVVPAHTVELVVGLLLPLLLGGAIRTQVRPAVNSVTLDVLGSSPHNHVISHHRLRRRARAERNRIEALQRVSRAGDYSEGALAKLTALGVATNDTLKIPNKRIGGWWVVEVVG